MFAKIVAVSLLTLAISWLLASVNRDTATSLANIMNLQGMVNKIPSKGKTA